MMDSLPSLVEWLKKYGREWVEGSLDMRLQCYRCEKYGVYAL